MFPTTDQLEGAGIFGALYITAKVLAFFFKDKNKEMELGVEKIKLALQFDDQNAQQEERLIPHFQDLLKNLQLELIEIKGQLKEATGRANNMEIQITRLSSELTAANEVIRQRDLTIVELKAKVPPERLNYIQ